MKLSILLMWFLWMVGVAHAQALPQTGSATPQPPTSPQSLTSSVPVAVVATEPVPAPIPPPAPQPNPVSSLPLLEEATIATIHEAIQTGKLTCEQLVNAYLDRIKNYNLSTAMMAPINAITEINPFVLEDAKQLDKQYMNTHQLAGKLHCIPVLLKDNVDTYDMTSTSGSFALLGNQPVKDAFLVSQLRKAGAILLGKGTMDEFASGLSGISSRSGRTGNAYNPSQNPGGSSSGPAAAVSANFVMIGIGTDNSGSVRVPAAFNGIVGLRPTMGLISRSGIFPRGNIDGIAGPLTRTVADLATVLDVVAQPDPGDKTTLNMQRPATYTAFLNANGLQGKRIGIIRRAGKFDPYKSMPKEVQAEIEKAVAKMQELGATVVLEVNLPAFNNDRKLNEAGEVQDVNEYLDTYPATRRNFRDICESDRTRTFGSVNDCLQFMKKLPKRNSERHTEVLELLANNRQYVEKMMETEHLDALMMPIASTGVATYDDFKVNTWQAPVSSNAGLPSLSFNIGYINQMPVGIELIGKAYSENTLIEMAYAYEKHAPPRLKPILPVSNPFTASLSIAGMNNLFTLLGARTYQYVLKNGTREDLTAENFRRIAADTLSKFAEKNENVQQPVAIQQQEI
ncbi:amidase [Aquicella lusitana]|uniref:Aspartyl-tRNA(Asn)/glutamyl-tRNA(Gln) amidotransferase subunit A n=1 Tax=Aquicella lusitana TaxID=254246 RepID=A0A370GFF9_9COXI|nr:amidase [Aquicella lusitana]RDI42538.1 aspartyl-tRNA(Asn)/glutamyl-tRNA(Gln) amidotransferase subunit A [Aquicella lusitana]VVC74317.1 Glutamyl-tRNA(Gln) amidotransferase subunit A [Aquicella lusitana]